MASGLAVWTLKPPEPRPVSRFDYDLPEGHQLGAMGFGTLALSPYSRYFVYSTLDGVYLRSMTELDARLISGSEGTVNSPYFSPDGEWVAYIGPIGSQLKKIPTSGGLPVLLSESPSNTMYEVSWSTDGMIVFVQDNGIYWVSQDGGTPQLLIEARDGEQVEGPQVSIGRIRHPQLTEDPLSDPSCSHNSIMGARWHGSRVCGAVRGRLAQG